MLPDHYFHDQEDRTIKKIVLKHLCMRANLLRAAGDDLQRVAYFHKHSDLACVFEVLRDYYKTYMTLPSYDIFLMELGTLVGQFSPPLSEEELQRYQDVLREWYNETRWDDEYVRDVIAEVLQQDAVRTMMTSVDSNDDLDVVRSTLKQTTARLNSNMFDGLVEETAWDNPEASMWEAQRASLGLGFLDQAMDGGPAKQEAVLIVAPSGGGKTTLGLQIASTFVNRNEHVSYWATEQPLQGDLSVRQFALGTGTTRSTFDRGWDSVPEEVKNRIDKVKPRWRKYFHFLDCRRSQRAVDSIEDLFVPIDEMKERGIENGILILDWWGRLRARMLMQQSFMSDSRSRIATSDWIGNLVDEAKVRNTRLLVLHQLSGEAAKKGPGAKPSTHDAQEDKNLNNMFEFGFAMSKLDSDNRCRIVGDKARSLAPSEGWLQLMGNECKFITLDAATMDIGDAGNDRVFRAEDVNDNALEQGGENAE